MSVNVESRPTYPLKYENRWVSDDVHGLYIHDMKQHPLLPKEEVARLSQCVQEGIAAQGQLDTNASIIGTESLALIIHEGTLARNAIVAANTGLVMKWANRHRGRGIEYEDLVQAGNLGLIRAAEKFDPTMGNAFSTYATRWIRATVEKEAHTHGRTIAVPLEESQSLSKLRRIRQEYEVTTGVEMSNEEMAKAMGLAIEKVVDLITMEKSVGSYDLLVGDDDDVELNEYLMDRDAEPIDEQVTDRVIEQTRRDALRKLLDNSGLAEDKLLIVRMHYGLETGEPLSNRKIASKLGLGSSSIDTKLRAALVELKIEATQTGLRFVVDEESGVNE